MLRPMENKGIICIETECDITIEKNKLPLNSEHLLQFLSKVYGIPYIYRKVATIEELKYYFKKFKKKEYSENYHFFYFSFHGESNQICFESGDSLKLSELSDMAKGVFDGKFVHFGSCRTMYCSATKIEEFRKSASAKMVSGFTKKVDADLCAIHDLALMAETISYKQVPTIINHMDNLYGGLQEKLGFRYSIPE